MRYQNSSCFTPGCSLNSALHWLGVVLVVSPLWAETPSVHTPPAASIRVTTHMVLVDVVVTGKKGNPVTDLTRDDFKLVEDGKPEKLAVFSRYPEVSPEAGSAGTPTESTSATPTPLLGPHVYTNRPQYDRSAGPLTILLLDAINTATSDQTVVRDHILRYLRTQPIDQKMAVLALTNDLLVLQDFTSDPRVLIALVEKYSPTKSVPLAQSQPMTITRTEAAALPPQALEALRRWNESRFVEATADRVRITLSALQAIARAMIGYPGRKNLVWVSSTFPISLDSAQDRSGLRFNVANELRQTANLLADAQVAVYTVDARGLVPGSATGPGELAPTVEDPNQPIVGETELTDHPEVVDNSHSTMQELARDTGGQAFYDQNEIHAAVAASIADGASYYTIGYYPQKRKWDGKFRRIEVKTARKGLLLRYRQGYYAVDTTAATTATGAGNGQDELGQLLAEAANPLPATGLTFSARVVPPAAGQTNLQVDFMLDANSVSFEEVEKGLQHCSLDFAAFTLTADGKLLSSVGKNVEARLQPAQYAHARQNGLPFNMEVKSDSASRELRLAVRDGRTGLVGTVTIPLPLDEQKSGK
jgi:VWFA-related protein